MRNRLTENFFIRLAGAYLVAYIGYVIFGFRADGYLPAPFFRDAHDTFMDFFNVNWWAMHGGFYSEWEAIYTPFNILFGKVLAYGWDGGSDALKLRADQLDRAVWFGAITWLGCVYQMRDMLKGAKNSHIWLFLLSFSFPMLFLLERGNHLLLTLLATLYYIRKKDNFGAAIESIIISQIIISKVYMAVILITDLVKNKWRRPALVALFSVISLYILGWWTDETDWYTIPNNILGFSSGSKDPVSMFSPGTDLIGLATRLNFAFELPSFGSKALTLGLSLISIYSAYIFYRTSIQFREGQLDEAMYIISALVTLMLITGATGFYSIVLLYPWFLSSIKKQLLTQQQRILFLLLLIPYPLLISKSTINEQLSAFNPPTFVHVEMGLPLQNVIIPLILFFLLHTIKIHASIGSINLQKSNLTDDNTNIINPTSRKVPSMTKNQLNSPLTWLAIAFVLASLLILKATINFENAISKITSKEHHVETKLYLKGLISNPEVFYQISIEKENRGDYDGAILDLKFAIGLLEAHNSSSDLLTKYKERTQYLSNKRISHNNDNISIKN